jgi:hypothetical protein
LAISALLRLLPLTYTDEGLRGFGRDMARARGVTYADRTTLVAP